VIVVCLAIPALKVMQVRLDPRVIPATTVRKDRKVFRVPRVIPELRALMALRGLEAILVRQVRRGLTELLALRVFLVLRGYKVPRVIRVIRVQRDRRATGSTLAGFGTRSIPTPPMMLFSTVDQVGEPSTRSESTLRLLLM
jgi:hypothetical protein